MTDIQFTVDAEGLKGLFEKSDGVDKLLVPIPNEILETQVTEALGAQRHERMGVCRGYRTRDFYTQRRADDVCAAGA